MCESVAAHYGDAPDDLVVADYVELPWHSSRGGMQWEWRVVSLKDIFPGELLALCVQVRDVGPEEELGGWRSGDGDAGSRARPEQCETGPEQGGGQPARRVGEEGRGERPAAGESARIPSAPVA